MSNSVENAFKSFGDVLMSEIEAERARASIAENSMKLLVDGLRSLLDELPRPANDSEPSKGQHSKVVGKGASRSIIADETLLDALTSDWITAGKLRQLLISRGITIAEGTVYNRMRTLASDRPDQIEAALKPERWRLLAPRKVTSPAVQQGKSVAKRTTAQSRHLSVVPTTQFSSAQSDYRIHPPVLHHGDCLEVMKALPDDSVDLILADLPYGTTHLGIDARLNLVELWSEYRRILRKPHGNIVLFGVQPFTTSLINAAPDLFKYPLVWMKDTAVGFQFSCSRPLMKHEDILVFSYGVNYSAKRSKRRATYNDQHALPIIRVGRGKTKIKYLGRGFRGHTKGQEYVGRTNCQNSILNFPKDSRKSGEKAHPFAKPLALLEHLIRTYSNDGDVVLDNTMGSGSTCIAAMRSGRRSIGIEMDREWFDLAKRRVEVELLGDSHTKDAA